MAWVQLQCDKGALVSIDKTTLEISWNYAAHSMMRFPRRINLFYDAEAGRLGFKKSEAETDLSACNVTTDGVFSIDALQHLTNAGLKPTSFTTELMQPPPPDEHGYSDGIYWIKLTKMGGVTPAQKEKVTT